MASTSTSTGPDYGLPSKEEYNARILHHFQIHKSRKQYTELELDEKDDDLSC